MRVSGQSTLDMTAIEKISVKPVSNRYIRPGPSIIRTAFRSFVDRAMMSPVRYLA